MAVLCQARALASSARSACRKVALTITCDCLCAGLLSSWGFTYLSDFLEAKTGLRDTCGVHNLHGMPGVLGAHLACRNLQSYTSNNVKPCCFVSVSCATFGVDNLHGMPGVIGVQLVCKKCAHKKPLRNDLATTCLYCARCARWTWLWLLSALHSVCLFCVLHERVQVGRSVTIGCRPDTSVISPTMPYNPLH